MSARTLRPGGHLGARPPLLLAALLSLTGCTSEEESAEKSPSLPGFFWGAATAAHQVEGGNDNDWTVWEELGHIDGGQQSGLAADHYRRFDEDFALAASLGHNAHRLSLEWSRIEPERDRYDPAALAHYHEVFASLKRHGLIPLVTLHHFSHPRWVLDPARPDQDLDAWRSDETVAEFVEYCTDMAKEFGGEVDWWVPINEPFVLANAMYIQGGFPSDTSPLQLEEGRRALFRLFEAHAAAYHVLHAEDRVDADGDGQACRVGSAKHIRIIVPQDPERPEDVAGARQVDHVFNQVFFDALLRGQVDSNLDGECCAEGTDPPEQIRADWAGTLDFIGLNYYSRSVVAGFPGLPYLQGLPMENPDPQVEHNEMGWEIYPDGLRQVLLRYAGEGLPLIVTENGVPDGTDAVRGRFLVQHLDALAAARGQGAPVLGYLHWSLIDNFEWTHGFGPRFGLVAVDYETQERTPRASAELYAEILRQNGEITDEQRARVGLEPSP